ncbi:MAG: multidrug efflux RND transporter permease subunit [Chromatiaceae bacterium]
MFSKFFIERPVLSNVIAIIIVLIGAVALYGLPVSQYPDITPPIVQVQTRYPGASAQTIADTVANPIEEQINGVEGMIYMQSTSAADGTYTLNVTFAVGTDLDFAQTLVQNRVAQALPGLPDPVQTQGVTTRKKSTAILQIITFSSPDGRYDSLFLANYATINLRDALARLPGVGDVIIFGAGAYSMRVWLDPTQLAARNLTPSDVVNAIRGQSQQVAAGQVGAPPAPRDQDFQITVNVPGRLADAQAFGDIIVKTEQGNGTSTRITRVRDVARIELGAQTYSQFFRLDTKQAAGIAVFQLPGANALDVAQEVSAKMAELSKNFPPGLEYGIPFDTTLFVKASIHEVYKTLFEAAILVLIVILVFVQDWRAMLVPATTVPVTIIGAFAAMAAMGFTINLLTLFAIVLAIGIVVDDAIVIVEGSSHHIEQGKPPKQAAIAAMSELFGPIIGITLVLMSVFLPAAFLPGITGQMYRQFALVIAATALISAINAVTLKPTQCALWMRPVQAKKNVLYRGFNALYGAVERAYTRLIGRMVHRSFTMTLIAVTLAAIAVWGLARLPTSFIPIEDQGYVLVNVKLPDGASLERTHEVMAQVEAAVMKVPGVEHAISIGGISVLDNSATLANSGVTYVVLKPWDVRGTKEGLRPVLENIQSALSQISDGVAFVLVPPPIQGIGNASGFQMQVELRDNSKDYAKLQRVAQAITADAATQSGILRVLSTFSAGVPQIMVDVDRVKARQLGVEVKDVFDTLQGYLGSVYVNQFNRFGRTFQVYVQADHQYRLEPADVGRFYVRNTRGDMIPIATLATIRYVPGPSLIGLYNLHPSAAVIGAPDLFFSSGQAMSLLAQIADHKLPSGMGYEWTGMSYQEKLVGSQAYFIFVFALVLVFLVLAGQYENWLTPFAVIFAVPLALLGTVGVLTALHVANNVYIQIGIVLLIALSSKNAILIVEYARDLHEKQGMGLAEAATEAARLRFRPILMTSFAFILGVLPLVLATGAGASSRKSIGITVFSGMLASTCIAVLFVPSFFVVFQRIHEWRERHKQTVVPNAGERPSSE